MKSEIFYKNLLDFPNAEVHWIFIGNNFIFIVNKSNLSVFVYIYFICIIIFKLATENVLVMFLVLTIQIIVPIP